MNELRNFEAPQSLLHNGQFLIHDVYRHATLYEREKVLVTGKSSDQLDIIPDIPWNGKGLLPTCDKSLSRGDVPQAFQWSSLYSWRSGLSCQLHFMPKQVLFDRADKDFIQQFYDRSRPNIVKRGHDTYRIVLVYELKKGSIIPSDIGIEIDGDNHVYLYPIGENSLVSDIEEGQAVFTVNAMLQLKDQWQPFAIIEVQASGFDWPDDFPPESNAFPFRQWLTMVISYAPSDISIDASDYTAEYVSQRVGLRVFSFKMISIGNRYAYDCPFEYIEINLCILKALRDTFSVAVLEG